MLDTLQREYNWLNWKRENCPPFEKSSTKKPLTTETLATKRKRDIPAVGEKKKKKLRLGNPELSRLWLLGDDALEDQERLTIPTLEELLTPIAKEMDPEAAIEEQYKKKK